MTLSTAPKRGRSRTDEALNDGVVGGVGAWHCLDAGSGQILAIFPHSVYIEGPAGLCCVGDSSLCAGPLNLRLRQPLPTPAHGDQWYVRDDRLFLGDAAAVSLRPRQLWRAPVLARQDAHCLRAAVACAQAALSAQSQAMSEADSARSGGLHATVERQLSHGCEALTRWLSTTDEDAAHGRAQVEITGLLGCGPGLTPSGDDIVAGTLVALRALGAVDAADRLGELLMIRAEQATGRISAAHLRAAATGEAVAPVHDLLSSLVAYRAHTDCIGIHEAIERLCGHGARSGRDAARGVLLAADAVAARQCSAGFERGTPL